MPNERVIVIGAGGISNAWFPPLVAEKLDVVAVVDINKAAAEKQIEKHALPNAIASDDLDATLRDVPADLAIDLTIPETHFAVTSKALATGLHVIGEKPMAATMEQARGLVAASERAGKLFMTSQSRRWDAKHMSIAATVRAGALGTITDVYCDFFIGAHFGGFREQMENVLLLDMSIHHFDLARMFTGLDARSVLCDEHNPAGSWYARDAAADCWFTMQNDVRFSYRGSWCAEGQHTSWNGDWRIVGTNGTLVYAADADPRGQVLEPTGAPGFHRPLRPLQINNVEPEATLFHGSLRDMLHAIRTGTTPQTECHDNIKSLAMVHAAIESSRAGKRVPLSGPLAPVSGGEG
jgi:predicted dehydrogenase